MEPQRPHTEPAEAASEDAELATALERILSRARNGERPDIVAAGHPVLRRAAAPWRGQIPLEQLHELAEVMRETLHHAPGVGLAAVQIGLNLRLAVLEDTFDVDAPVRAARARAPLDFLAVVNPSYTAVGDGMAEFYEGCLSVPGWQAVTPRHECITFTFLDLTGVAHSMELSGWAARIAQHETDHLAGTLYLDRAYTRSLTSTEHYQRLWSQPTPDLAREALGF